MASERAPLLRLTSRAQAPSLEQKPFVTLAERRTRVILLTLLILAECGALANAIVTILALTGKLHASFQTGDLPQDVLSGIAGIFTAFAVPLTVYDILCHIVFYRNPLQRFYIRVLWMVIIYACESFAALRDFPNRVMLETASAAYEAFTLYSFFRLCLDFLGPRSQLETSLATGVWPEGVISNGGDGAPKSRWVRILVEGNCCAKDDEDNDDDDTQQGKQPLKQTGKPSLQTHGLDTSMAPSSPRYARMIAPCCCLRPWKLGPDFLWYSSFGVLQYVVVRLGTAIATFILQAVDLYGENDLTHWNTSGYPWIVVLINLSQLWALYCLILFGFHLWEPLAPLKPMGKFVVVKWIVFISWWQSVLISGLNATGLFPEKLGSYDGDGLAAAIQDALICIEMVAAAYAHHKYFSHEDFQRPEVLARAAHLLAPPASPSMSLTPRSPFMVADWSALIPQALGTQQSGTGAGKYNGGRDSDIELSSATASGSSRAPQDEPLQLDGGLAPSSSLHLSLLRASEVMAAANSNGSSPRPESPLVAVIGRRDTAVSDGSVTPARDMESPGAGYNGSGSGNRTRSVSAGKGLLPLNMNGGDEPGSGRRRTDSGPRFPQALQSPSQMLRLGQGRRGSGNRSRSGTGEKARLPTAVSMSPFSTGDEESGPAHSPHRSYSAGFLAGVGPGAALATLGPVGHARSPLGSQDGRYMGKGHGVEASPDVGQPIHGYHADDAAGNGYIRSPGHTPGEERQARRSFAGSPLGSTQAGDRPASAAPPSLGILAAVTDMLLPVDVVMDVGQHVSVASAAAGAAVKARAAEAGQGLRRIMGRGTSSAGLEHTP